MVHRCTFFQFIFKREIKELVWWISHVWSRLSRILIQLSFGPQHAPPWTRALQNSRSHSPGHTFYTSSARLVCSAQEDAAYKNSRVTPQGGQLTHHLSSRTPSAPCCSVAALQCVGPALYQVENVNDPPLIFIIFFPKIGFKVLGKW